MAEYNQTLAFSKTSFNTNDERGKGSKDRMVVADNISYKKSGSLNKREGFAKYQEDVINNLSVFRHYDLMTIGLFDYNTMNDIGLVDGSGNEYRPFTGVLNAQGDTVQRSISNNLPLNPTRHVQFNLTDTARQDMIDNGIWDNDKVKEFQNDFMFYDNFFSNGEMVNEIIYTALLEESVKHIDPTQQLTKSQLDRYLLLLLIGQEKMFSDIIPRIEDLAIRQEVEDSVNAANAFINNRDIIVSNVLLNLQSFFEPKLTRVRDKVKEVYKMSNLFKESVVKTSYDKIQPLSTFNKLTTDEKNTFIQNLDVNLNKNFPDINDVYNYFAFKIEADGNFGDVYNNVFDIFLTDDEETVKDKLILMIQNTIGLDMYKQYWAENDISFFSTEESNALRNDIPFNRLNENYILTDERIVKYEAIKNKGFHGDKVGIGEMHIDDTNTFFPSVVYFSDYDHYQDPLLNNFLSNIGLLRADFLYATKGIDLTGDNLVGDLRIDLLSLIPAPTEFFDGTGYLLDHVVDTSSNLVMVANTQANGNLSNTFENIITIVLPKDLDSVAINRLRELDDLKWSPNAIAKNTKFIKNSLDNVDLYTEISSGSSKNVMAIGYDKNLLSQVPKKIELIKFKSLVFLPSRTTPFPFPLPTSSSTPIIEIITNPTNQFSSTSISGTAGLIITPLDPNFDPSTFDFDSFDPDTEIPANFDNKYTLVDDDKLVTTDNTGLILMLAYVNDAVTSTDSNVYSTYKRIWIVIGETEIKNATSATSYLVDYMKRYDKDIAMKSIPQGIIKTTNLKVRQATFKEGINKIEPQFVGSKIPIIPLSRNNNNIVSKFTYDISNIEPGYSAFLDDNGFTFGKNFDTTFGQYNQMTNGSKSALNKFIYLKDKNLPNIIDVVDSNSNFITLDFLKGLNANTKIPDTLVQVPDSYIVSPKFSFTINSNNQRGNDGTFAERIAQVIKAYNNNNLGIKIINIPFSNVLLAETSLDNGIFNKLISYINKIYNKNLISQNGLDDFTKSSEITFKSPKLITVGDGFRIEVDVTNSNEVISDHSSDTTDIQNIVESSLLFNALTIFSGIQGEDIVAGIQFVELDSGQFLSEPGSQYTGNNYGTYDNYTPYQLTDKMLLLEKTSDPIIKTGEIIQYNFDIDKPRILNGIEIPNTPIVEITKLIGIQQNGQRTGIPLDGTYNGNTLFTSFEVTSKLLHDINRLDDSSVDRIPKLEVSNSTTNTRSDIFDFLTDFSINDFADITMSVWNKNLYLESIGGISIENFSVGDIIGKFEMDGHGKDPIDWVKYKDQFFITTGKKIYILSIVKNNIITRKDINGNDETVGDDKYYISFDEMDNVAYTPNSQEYTLYGPNVIVDDIKNDVADSIGLPASIDFIRINPFKGQVGKTSTIKAIVSGQTQAEVDNFTYKWEYLDSESDGQFKEIKDDFPADSGATLTTKEISVVFPKDDTYTLRVTVTSGTTVLSELTKYTVSNSEVDVLTPVSLMNEINRCERVLVNGNTLIFYGNGTSNVYATAPENPYYFPFGNTLNISINKNEEVQCLVNLKDLVLAFTRTTISAITGKGNPAQIEALFDPYRVIQIESKVGAISRYAAINVENLAMFVSEDGFYMVKEVSVSDQRATLEPLGEKVRNIIPRDSSVNVSATEKRIFIGSAVTGSVLVYDYEFNKWATWRSANLKSQWSRVIDNIYYISNGVNILAKNALIRQNEFYTYPRYYFTDDKETYAMMFQTSQADLSVISSDFFVDASFAYKKATSFRMKWKYNETIKNYPTVTLIGGGEDINTPTNEYNNVQYENNNKAIPKPPAILSEFRLGENTLQIENGKDNYFVYMIDKSPWFMWYSVLFIHVGDSPMELTDVTTTYKIGPKSRDRNGKF